MTTLGIHGNLLQVTVVSCNRLKDTEWISRQDPYVRVEYGTEKCETRPCTDGGKNPNFEGKFVYTLIEGVRELNVSVWNSNLFKHDDFIASGKVQLRTAFSQGFDDSTWPLKSRSGRHAGEVRLIICYPSAIKPTNTHADVAPPSGPPQPTLQSPPPPPTVPYPPEPPVRFPFPPTSDYPIPSPYPSYPTNLAFYSPVEFPFPPTFGYPTPYPYPSYPFSYPHQPALYAQPFPPNSTYPPPLYESYHHPGPPYPGSHPPLFWPREI